MSTVIKRAGGIWAWVHYPDNLALQLILTPQMLKCSDNEEKCGELVSSRCVSLSSSCGNNIKYLNLSLLENITLEKYWCSEKGMLAKHTFVNNMRVPHNARNDLG